MTISTVLLFQEFQELLTSDAVPPASCCSAESPLPQAHLPAALGKCGALSPRPTRSQHCLFTTGPPAPSPAQAVNQRCHVGLRFRKSMVDRAELDYMYCTVSPKHIFSRKHVLCRSMILSISSTLLPWLLPPSPRT